MTQRSTISNLAAEKKNYSEVDLKILLDGSEFVKTSR